MMKELIVRALELAVGYFVFALIEILWRVALRYSERLVWPMIVFGHPVNWAIA